jgi:hypothetical protein
MTKQIVLVDKLGRPISELKPGQTATVRVVSKTINNRKN